MAVVLRCLRKRPRPGSPVQHKEGGMSESGQVDPWVQAAADAGDSRAMLCLAHQSRYGSEARVRWQRRAAEAGNTVAMRELADDLQIFAAFPDKLREALHWYTAAALGGDMKSVRALAVLSPDRPERDRWLRVLFENGQTFEAYVQVSQALEAKGHVTEALELWRAGAHAGFRYCMLRWADYLRRLGWEHQAEANLWSARAAHEEAQTLRQPPSYQPAAPGALVTVVITAVVTTGLVPFVQQMISKAAEDSYAALRTYLREHFRRRAEPHSPSDLDQLLIVRPPDGERPDAVLQVWTDLPDDAIAALVQLLHDMRSLEPSNQGERRWYWNSTAHRWQILELPPLSVPPQLPDTADSTDH